MIYNLPFGTYKFHSGIATRHPLCEGNKCKFIYPCNDSYPCDSIDINLSVGEYLFEAYGAAGLSPYIIGGLGGYARAKINITTPVPIYLFLGGKGKYWANSSYNGGGSSYPEDFRYDDEKISGGGATDFRLNYTDLSSRFLVGSGGGSARNYYLSSGGGLTAYSFRLEKMGANQTSPDLNGQFPGGFGYGGSCGGGGGLYGGAGGCYQGSGGSSFVYSADRECQEIRDINEIGISNGLLEGAMNPGHGYAVITHLSNKYANIICKYEEDCLQTPNSNFPALLFNLIA